MPPERTRAKIQLKTRVLDATLSALLRSHHTMLFYSRDINGAITASSRAALSMIRRHAIDAHFVEAPACSSLETALQAYSGWQYFPQLYVASEFIGGNIVMPEFFASGEYSRILSGLGAPMPPPAATPVTGTNDKRAIWKLSLSLDMKYLAVARASGFVDVIRMSDRTTLRQIKSHDGWVNTARFDADATRIYSGGSDAVLRSWNREGEREPHTGRAHTRWINDIAVEQGTNCIASVGADRIVRIWNQDLQPISQHDRHTANIWCALGVRDGFVSADENGFVIIARSTEFGLTACFRAHGNGVTSLSNGLEADTICTTSYDGVVRGWSLSGDRLFEYRGHSERVWTACPIRRYQAFASGSADRSVDIWDPNGGNRIRRFNFEAQPLALCYSEQQNVMVVGLSNGHLIWQEV